MDEFWSFVQNKGNQLKRLNRKTVCFSKNEQLHDNVIGVYIEKYYI
ncbi:MAG: IS1 family transposase [Prevotellaceae bacterium]|nr:IS1 family transposase [Prevotellaceae bacterium]